jgi:hypothetical protein
MEMKGISVWRDLALAKIKALEAVVLNLLSDRKVSKSKGIPVTGREGP